MKAPEHAHLRLYPNGSMEWRFAPLKDLEAEVAYSKRYRPGCALFLDGECRQAGTLVMDDLVRVGKEWASLVEAACGSLGAAARLPWRA